MSLWVVCKYTFFFSKPHHRVSWRHPRSTHWHQLDLILTRSANLSTIKITSSYQSADCDVSWRHPRSTHWHQLDLILTRSANLSTIKITSSYQSADCDTDHSLVCINVKLLSKSLHRTRKEGVLESTPAKHAIKEKWRSLRVCWRILFLAHQMQMPRTNGNTLAILSTGRNVHLWQKDHQASWLVRSPLRRNGTNHRDQE